MFDAHAQAIDRCILEVQIVGKGAEPRLDQSQAARIFQRSFLKGLAVLYQGQS
jgi:hypothetical protein